MRIDEIPWFPGLRLNCIYSLDLHPLTALPSYNGVPVFAAHAVSDLRIAYLVYADHMILHPFHPETYPSYDLQERKGGPAGREIRIWIRVDSLGYIFETEMGKL